MGEEKHHPPEYWNVPTALAPWEAFAGYSVYRQQQQNSHGCISAVRPKETWPEVVGLTVEEAASQGRHAWSSNRNYPEEFDSLLISSGRFICPPTVGSCIIDACLLFNGRKASTPIDDPIASDPWEEQQINPTHDGTGELPPPALPRIYGLPEGSTAEPTTTWPEVVGLTAEAEKKIKEDKPGAQIQVIPPDSVVTVDFKSGRIRLHVDSSGKVRMLPRIG